MSRSILLAFACLFIVRFTTFGADTTPPGVAAANPPAGTRTALTQITVTFDEPVTGVQSSDLLVNGVPADSVSGSGVSYTFTFGQPPYGPVQITWSPQHAIFDLAQPANRFDQTAPSSTWQYTLLDQTPPSIASLFPPSGATVRSLGEVQVTFSEDVAGVDAADLLLNGQPATNVFKVGSGPFIFQFPPAATGLANIEWTPNPGIIDFGVPPNAFTPVNWSYQVDPNAPRPDLVITEILAANQNGIRDEDGDEEGWFEIYNRGTTVANLANWSLSDDPLEPGLWLFETGTIPAGGYLVVFASGKDRRHPASTNRFHTNFRLANGGEFLGLYSPDSPRSLVSAFSPGYPEQRNDYSFGYDTNGTLRYFALPTPGAANGGSTILSLTESVRFSVERGFYSNAFDLYLSCPTLGSTIRYTVDGLEPTAITGLPYIGPLRITNSTMVRAVAFRPNFLPSRVRTHSYLFNLSPAQRSLPIINLVMTTSNWFGRSGILGMGGGSRASDGLYLTNNPATDYHNPSQHGIAWERPVSAEYILPDNSGFQIDCGIRVQGSDWQRPRTTLDSKFSYRLYFRGDYGEGKLEYPIFPTASVQSFDQVVLRAGFNEQINPFVRDEIIRRMSQDMGQVSSQGGLALVLRNCGPYTNNNGILPAYNPCERVNESFMQNHFGGNAHWDVVGPDFAVSSEGLGIVDGDRIDFRNLLTNVWTGSATRGISTPAQYQTMARRLDLVNFVDYCMLNAYTAMGDWPANNWRAGRERSTNGIWRFFVWDAEWGMGIYALAVTRDSFGFTGTGTEDAGLGSTVNSEIARLYQGLRVNPEFRLLWADRIQKHFFNGGALTGLNVSNRFNELRAQLEPSFSPPAAMDIEILQWARDRFPIIMSQFNLYGLYGYSNALYGVFASSNAPAFNQHGGRVPAGFSLTMTPPMDGTVYYTTNGHDPRVPFVGAVSNVASAYTGPVTLNQSMVIKARTLLGTNWSALNEAEFKVESLLPTLRVTEIMYNPIGGNAYEFIELENYGATPVDMSGMSFDGITFRFPNPTMLGPGARIVLASSASPTAFAARYPNVTVTGYFGGALNNGGERIALLDASGNTIYSVTYGNSGLWPVAANGAGYSLVLANANGDADNALSWVASAAQGGSPGQSDNFPVNPVTVRLNEISAASPAQWIELYNATLSPINVSGYSLTDDGQSRKFLLPSLIVPAGGYVVIDPTNHFTLNARGDEVLLYDTQTNLISRAAFGLQPAGYTASWINNDWTLGDPTPNAANVAAPLGSANSLVLNEWLANPISGEDDWLELWNNSAQPVALQGIYVGVSNALSRVGSLSFIGPYGFVQLFADGNPGSDHLDARLPASGTRMVVYDAAGVEVTRVDYGAQAENVSQGRLPDGSSTIQTFGGSASPGASNYVITYSGPYLNEVMARNVSAVTNAAGRAADWIEIYNPGASAVDLAGMSLSIDAPQPFQWIFPAGSAVAAGGYLLVWCDGDSPASTSFETTLNCGQSLDGDAGGVYLFSAAGQLVNFVEYGFQLADQSVGQQGGQWKLLQAFTPGAANAAASTLGAPTTITFNEWMTDSEGGGDDWFELYNSGTLPVDLGGMILTDDPSMAAQTKFRIAPLSFVAAKGFVKFEADSDPSKGLNHVNFSLSENGESLRLYNPPSFAPVASVYFGPQAANVSEGRLPDGSTNIARFPGSATPGESNYSLPANVAINEVLASANQVELYNPSSQPANVGGWFLSNTRADYKLFRIPDGTSIPAGGYIVLTPGTFALNTTTGGEVILAAADAGGNLTGQRFHAVYGRQAAGISFGRFGTSQGVQFVALAQPTLGTANSGALVGPIVISEILYNPPTDGIEYVELQNISGAAQSLMGWTLANAIHVSLPDVSLAPGEYISILIFPENGHLDNAGEKIDLLNAASILVDSVDYRDSSPWPSGLVDGGGLSLQRRSSTQFGNDPLNWVASEQTPEAPNGSGTVPLPVINTAPQSLTVPADASPVLYVDAAGGAPLSYQWRFNGLRISGATSRELPLNFVQLEQSGTYDVLVSNPAGVTISPAATLSVLAAPIIVVPPQNQTIATNATATLFVVARASAPVSYQWSFNGTNIPGANSTSYTITGTSLQHIGEYSVLVSNPLGSAFASAYLSVLVPPIFTLQPVSQTIAEGDDATFRAAVVGLPPFGFRWRRPGVSTISNAIGWDTPIITLTNVPMSYSNNSIDLIASNPVRPAPGGVQSRQVRLFVLPDADHDKLPDIYETANGLNPTDPGDAFLDKDGDGVSNRDEYIAGTDPNDPNSFLRVTLVSADLNTPAVLLSFNAASNKTYTVQYSDTLGSVFWSKLLDVESEVTNRAMRVTDSSPNAASRFYKLISPATR